MPRNIVNCLVHVSLGRAKWAPYNAMGSNFSHNSLLISTLSILTSHQAKCQIIENEKDWSFQIKDWQYLRKHLLYLLLSTSSITFSLPACPFVLFLIKKTFWITGQGYHHPIPRAVISVTGCLVYLISSRTFHLLQRTLLQFEIVDQEIERFSIWQNVNTQKKLKSIWPYCWSLYIWPQDVIGG